MELNISIPAFITNFVIDEFWKYTFYGFLCGYVIPLIVLLTWSKIDNYIRLKRYEAGEAQRRLQSEEAKRIWEENL